MYFLIRKMTKKQAKQMRNVLFVFPCICISLSFAQRDFNDWEETPFFLIKKMIHLISV